MKTGPVRPVQMLLLIAATIIAGGTLVTGCSKESAPHASHPPAAQAPSAGSSVTASPDSKLLAEGEEIFKQMCKSCHGSGGNGLGRSKGPSLQRTDYTYGRNLEAITQSIRDGRPGGMPSFSHVLLPRQLEAVSSYVMTLKK